MNWVRVRSKKVSQLNRAKESKDRRIWRAGKRYKDGWAKAHT